MKKRTLLILLAILCLAMLAACGAKKDDKAANTIEPMASKLDINALDNGDFFASFTAKDIYLNDDGMLVIHMNVYDVESFDSEKIQAIKEGDNIVVGGKTVKVSSVKNDEEEGTVTINDNISVYLSESGDYTVAFKDGEPCYFLLGEATLPVAQEFLFHDYSEGFEKENLIYPGDLITDISGTDREFLTADTIITVKDGWISEMLVMPGDL